MIDKVYLINLKRRPDRLANFRKLQNEKGWKLPEPIIFEAIDGNKVGTPDFYTAGGGAFGCRQSHISVLERAVMDDVNSLLVLEDDVTWHTGAWEQLETFLNTVPDDWQQLMLGGQHIQSAESIAPGVSRCLNTQRTHAYAIRGGAIKDLLRLWYKCNSHIDHIMGGWQAGYRVYSPEPFIFGQDRGQSDISGANNPAKFWVAPSNDTPVIHLTASKEVTRELRGYGLHTGYDRCPITEYDKGLIEVAANPTANNLKHWLDVILWEAASEENTISTVWHPAISPQLLKQVWNNVIEVTGNSAADCLSQLPPNYNFRKNYALSYVILLRSPRQVMESLKAYGFHSGYWRDEVTGIDNGLRKIATLIEPERNNQLRAWIQTVSNEATSIHNGVTCIWHDDIWIDDVYAATTKKVVVIEADTTADALEIWRIQQ